MLYQLFSFQEKYFGGSISSILKTFYGGYKWFDSK